MEKDPQVKQGQGKWVPPNPRKKNFFEQRAAIDPVLKQQWLKYPRITQHPEQSGAQSEDAGRRWLRPEQDQDRGRLRHLESKRRRLRRLRMHGDLELPHHEGHLPR